MSWYKNMSEQQKRTFQIVIVVCVVGVIAVLLAPMVFRKIFQQIPFVG